MNYKPLPSQERLQYLLYYNEKTGKLYHRFRRTQGKIGQSGTITETGYLLHSVDGSIYRTHRLIWMYMTGEDPGQMMIDHINGDRSDNRFSNLRKVTRKQNGDNQPRVKGYTWNKLVGKWQAQIQHHGKFKNLGYFDNEADARAAYVKAKVELCGDCCPENIKAEFAPAQ